MESLPLALFLLQVSWAAFQGQSTSCLFHLFLWSSPSSCKDDDLVTDCVNYTSCLLLARQRQILALGVKERRIQPFFQADLVLSLMLLQPTPTPSWAWDCFLQVFRKCFSHQWDGLFLHLLRQQARSHCHTAICHIVNVKIQPQLNHLEMK